ncbi:hypothetical protein GCM10027167_37350 [Nocardia heshunensis]
MPSAKYRVGERSSPEVTWVRCARVASWRSDAKRGSGVLVLLSLVVLPMLELLLLVLLDEESGSVMILPLHRECRNSSIGPIIQSLGRGFLDTNEIRQRHD